MSMKDQFIYINLCGVDRVAEKMRKKETGKRMQEDGSSHGERGRAWSEKAEQVRQKPDHLLEDKGSSLPLQSIPVVLKEARLLKES